MLKHVWPYGVEVWPFLEGRYFYIYANYGETWSTKLETSSVRICSLALLGTKYGRSEEFPASIDVIEGQIKTFIV